MCCWDFALASLFLWEPGHSDSPSVLYLNSDARTACRKSLPVLRALKSGQSLSVTLTITFSGMGLGGGVAAASEPAPN